MAKKDNKKTVYSTDWEEKPGSAFDALQDLQPERPNPPVQSQSMPPQGGPPSNPAAANPDVQRNIPVRVHRDRKGRRGKTVSVITGVQGSTARKKALLKLLKQKLGTGGALKEDGIEIQGEQRERIVEILNELGYPAKMAGG